MSIYQASKTFGTSKPNLRDKRSGKYKNAKRGIQPVLSINKEKVLVDWLLHLATLGIPVTRSQLLETVGKFVNNVHCNKININKHRT